MKLDEAMDIIETSESGYMVHFEERNGGILKSDHFPDKHAGEELIKTLDGAWELAERFAKACVKNKFDIVNVYVIDHTFSPVAGYDDKKLNRH